jgi:hypothetical protein
MANWNCAVPDEHADVVIGSKTVVISSPVVCRSIDVGPGAVVQVGNGYEVRLTGK